MKSQTIRTLFAASLMLLLGTVGTGFAASYTFNFNSVSAGANNSAIQSYMQGVVGGAATVSLSGAKEANGYNGDGHVVNGTTLGNDEGGTDRFIITLQSGSTDTIKMQFTGLQLYTVTFDYEIFPDATCTSPTNCTNGLPDFSFWAGNGGTTSQIFHDYGSFPASGSHSPASGPYYSERSAQKIVYSSTYTASGGSSFDTIWFQDWPATIGVDNITITTRTPPPAVPEPASVLLCGTGILAVIRRRKLAK